MANTQTPVIIQQQRKQFGAGDALMLAVVGTGLFFGGRYFIRQYKKSQADQHGDDPAYQIAKQIWDDKGTFLDDEESAVRLAKTIKEKGLTFKDVAKAFEQQNPGRTLDSFLSFLSTENRQRFNDLMNLTASVDPKTGQTAPINSQTQWTRGLFAVAKSKVTVRKTPRYVSNSVVNVLAANNRISYADQGQVIGIVTGRTSADEKASPIVLFVEVMAAQKGTDGKITYVPVWIAASQVEAKTQKQIAGNTKVYGFVKELYDAAASISGVSEAPDYTREVVTTRNTSFLDNNMQPVQQVAAGIILGYPVMELHTGKITMLKFISARGFTWWVDKANTLTRAING